MSVPRGRHAPSPDERQERDRNRFFETADVIWRAEGFASMSVESLARTAGMSKSTFYGEWANIREFVAEMCWCEERKLAELPGAGGPQHALLLASLRAAESNRIGWRAPGLSGPKWNMVEAFVAELARLGYSITREAR